MNIQDTFYLIGIVFMISLIVFSLTCGIIGFLIFRQVQQGLIGFQTSMRMVKQTLTHPHVLISDIAGNLVGKMQKKVIQFVHDRKQVITGAS